MARRKRIPIAITGNAFRSEALKLPDYVSPFNSDIVHKNATVRFERFVGQASDDTTDVLMIVSDKKDYILDVFSGKTRKQVEKMADKTTGLLVKLEGFETKAERMNKTSPSL